MALVYVNSVFTIAALKSPGSSGGCFTDERNPLGLRPLRLDDLGVTVTERDRGRLWEMEVNTSGYGASPLHSRAWVVQERLSSPRTLLYGSLGVYWECRCAQASESHSRELAWDSSRNKKTWLQKLEAGLTDAAFKNLSPASELESESYRHVFQTRWADLLGAYSSCELTMKTDKIMAATGLISEIERRAEGRPRCVRGLWSHDLPGMALWYRARNDASFPTDAVGRLQNDTPTWTWASVEGRCSYMMPGGRTEWRAGVKIDEGAAPATMEIDSWRRKVLRTEDDVLVLDRDDPRSGAKGWGGDLDDEYTLFPDCQMASDEEPLLYAVLIQRIRVVEKPPIWVARCLVVTPSLRVGEKEDGGAVDERPVFTRVGIVLIRFSDPRDNPFRVKDDGARDVSVLE
jgi:hypothetical protein